MSLDQTMVLVLFCVVIILAMLGIMHDDNMRHKDNIMKHEVRMAELGYTHVDGNWIKSK